MRKFYVVIAILSLFCSVSLQANAQNCQPKFDYQVTAGSDQGEIQLTLTQGGQGKYQIKLYDMVKGAFVLEKEVSLSVGESYSFDRLTTSSYFIYVWYQGCDKQSYTGIGGKYGIQVGK